MIIKFLTLYSSDSPHWQDIKSLAAELGWLDLVSQSTAEYLDVHGISKKFTREVVESATRVNYAQVGFFLRLSLTNTNYYVELE